MSSDDHARPVYRGIVRPVIAAPDHEQAVREEVAKRVKAARFLAGYPSVKALAAQINQQGLSYGVLRQYEEARRTPIIRSQLHAIAEACDLPLDWFYVDIPAAIRAARQPGVARLPPLTGELARRVGGEPTDIRDRQRGESRPAGDAQQGNNG